MTDQIENFFQRQQIIQSQKSKFNFHNFKFLLIYLKEEKNIEMKRKRRSLNGIVEKRMMNQLLFNTNLTIWSIECVLSKIPFYKVFVCANIFMIINNLSSMAMNESRTVYEVERIVLSVTTINNI